MEIRGLGFIFIRSVVQPETILNPMALLRQPTDEDKARAAANAKYKALDTPGRIQHLEAYLKTLPDNCIHTIKVQNQINNLLSSVNQTK